MDSKVNFTQIYYWTIVQILKYIPPPPPPPPYISFIISTFVYVIKYLLIKADVYTTVHLSDHVMSFINACFEYAREVIRTRQSV